MKVISTVLLLLTASTCIAAPLSPLSSDQEINEALASSPEDFEVERYWHDPQEPFRIIGNIHYVGTKELSVFLVTTPRGHFLIDGALKQSPTAIIANIAKLGFDVKDVRYLLNSHAHFDHAGGLAALKRASGAKMVASAEDKPILEAGENIFDGGKVIRFPAVRVDRVVGDAEALELGGTTLTARVTPGHTPGCTSWTMDVADQGGPVHTVLFHCSASVGGLSLFPETYPGQITDFRETFARFYAMKADILLVNHAFYFNMHAKLARQSIGEKNAFVDPQELARFNAEMVSNFEAELKIQQEDY